MKSFLDCHSTIALLATLLLTGCSGQQQTSSPTGDQPAGEQKVELATVIAGTLPRSTEVPASVEPYERVKIMSRLEGHVETIHVDIGQRVQQGDLLATLQVQELHDDVISRSKQKKQTEAELKSREAEVAVAKSKVAQAEAQTKQNQALVTLRTRELTRITGLVQNGALEKMKMEEAEFALQSAQATLETTAADIAAAKKGIARATAAKAAAKSAIQVAHAELNKSKTLASYTQIKAPFEGLVTERLANTGSLVLPASDSSATALFEIVTDQRMRIVSFIPMKEATLINNGDRVQIDRLQGLPGVTLTASITRHARAFHRGARMMRIEIDVANPIEVGDRQISLKSGDYGFAVIDLHQYDQISTIPQSALSVEQSKYGKSHVIVVNDTKQCSKQEVQVLVRYENAGGTPVVGVTGLSPGQKVISTGVTSFLSIAEKNETLPGNTNLVEHKFQINKP